MLSAGIVVSRVSILSAEIIVSRVPMVVSLSVSIMFKYLTQNPHRTYSCMTIVFYLETDRTNVCWVEEGCSSLKPPSCSSSILDVVDHVNKFDSDNLNLHLNKGCYTGSASLNTELNNAPASCNPPCFRIMLPGEYCYMGTRNNNFSNRRHVGKIIVSQGSAFPKLDYGSKSYPGKSCEDIKDIRDKAKENRANGAYWILLKRSKG